MNEYIENVIKTVEKRDNAKPEYIQCVKEVFRSLEKVIEQHPEYVEDDLLTRMAEPDRLITFRVAWVDDAGKTQINRGYRVQFKYRPIQRRITLSPECKQFNYVLSRL